MGTVLFLLQNAYSMLRRRYGIWYYRTFRLFLRLLPVKPKGAICNPDVMSALLFVCLSVIGMHGQEPIGCAGQLQWQPAAVVQTLTMPPYATSYC